MEEEVEPPRQDEMPSINLTPEVESRRNGSKSSSQETSMSTKISIHRPGSSVTSTDGSFKSAKSKSTGSEATRAGSERNSSSKSEPSEPKSQTRRSESSGPKSNSYESIRSSVANTIRAIVTGEEPEDAEAQEERTAPSPDLGSPPMSTTRHSTRTPKLTERYKAFKEALTRRHK